MNKSLSYEEYKKVSLKNKYGKSIYENDLKNGINAEKKLQRSYDRWIDRYNKTNNALKKIREYEKNINERYDRLKNK